MFKFIQPISTVLNTAVGLLKDTKGKLSSKRTISGLIVMAAIQDISTNGITYLNLILMALGVVPVLFALFEKKD